MIKTYYSTFFIALFLFSSLSAQKVLQVERSGKAKTEKFYIGQPLTFQLKKQVDKDEWFTAVIEDLLVEDSVIVLGPRYLHIRNLKAFKFERNWPQVANKTMLTFGVSWSGFALVGTLTDNNPDTNYRWSDAVVSGTAILVGTALPALFKTRKIKFGKRKRLRMLNLTPVNSNQ